MDLETKSFCDYESRFFDIKGSEKIGGKKKYLEDVKSQDTSRLKKNRLRDFSITNNPITNFTRPLSLPCTLSLTYKSPRIGKSVRLWC
jgi:hypothetical protein